MPLILSIDTAFENAAISLADGKEVIGIKTNDQQTDHAGWIHTGIKELFNEASKNLQELAAVAVTAGPGSYTGLRVGMATAKGLCFALNIPFITESTLKLIALALKTNTKADHSLPLMYTPMIDARRMEVFTSIYNSDLEIVTGPSALVLDSNSFANLLNEHILIFGGNGTAKWQSICHHRNARFSESSYNITDLSKIAFKKHQRGEFTEPAYAEPIYGKNVYTGPK